jgi:hypothetical protein
VKHVGTDRAWRGNGDSPHFRANPLLVSDPSDRSDPSDPSDYDYEYENEYKLEYEHDHENEMGVDGCGCGGGLEFQGGGVEMVD